MSNPQRTLEQILVLATELFETRKQLPGISGKAPTTIHGLQEAMNSQDQFLASIDPHYTILKSVGSVLAYKKHFWSLKSSEPRYTASPSQWANPRQTPGHYTPPSSTTSSSSLGRRKEREAPALSDQTPLKLAKTTPVESQPRISKSHGGHVSLAQPPPKFLLPEMPLGSIGPVRTPSGTYQCILTFIARLLLPPLSSGWQNHPEQMR